MDTGLMATDVAGFTGQSVSYYSTYIIEAISQAEDLFVLATALTAPPTDALLLRVFRRGILEMAEHIYEGQQYRSVRFSPFRSQNIGSYSYTLAERAILQGVPTGVSWFDLAVSLLSREPGFAATSVHVFDRPGDMIEGSDGKVYLPGPADWYHDVFGEGPDPSEGYGWSGLSQ